jgi:hypothetical protein
MSEQTEQQPIDEDDGHPKFGRLLIVLLLAVLLVCAITYATEAYYT